MDIYQIMARLDAIGSKKTLAESQEMAQPVAEGQMKRSLEARAEQMSKADFVANAGEYGMSSDEAAEFWTAVNGEEELDEERRTDADWDAQALAQQKAKLAREKNKMDMQRRLQNPEKYTKDNIDEAEVAGQFKPGDRVMYLNTFATVVKCDGETCGIKVDGKPGTMMVSASQLKKPSYNEGAAEGDDSVLPLLKKFISMKSDPADRQDLIKVYRAFQQGITQGFETLSNQWGTNLDAEFYHFAKQQGVDLNSIARKHGVLKDSVAESKKSKPDFLDMDKDGDKKEPMKKAVADKKKGAVKESEQNMSRAAKGYEKYGKQGMQALAKAGKEGKSLDPIRKKYDKYDESAKPDFLDLDRDGDKKEPMKKAAKDKNDAKGSFQKQMGGSAKDLTKGLSIGAKKVDEASKNLFPGTPEYELRFGKDDASSAFDKKKISTGTVYSRKHQEEPEADDDTPRTAGRPKGAKRRLGAKGPSVDSKLLKGKGGLKEGDIDIVDRGEYDREGDMALSQVHQIADAARELHAILASDDNLPEWVQSKITKALDYIDTARDYLGAEKEMDREELPEIAPIVGAIAGRALAGAAGAGRVGQAVGSMAGQGIASAMSSNDEVAEKAPPGAKAERMVKHIKKGYAQDGKLSDREKGIAYATAWKAKKAGKVEEEGLEKHSTGAVKAAASKDRAADKKSGVPANISTAELKAELKRRSQVEEESTDTKDQHAEKAGKKVTKDLEYDMKHKGKDDSKAEKAGKKVTKDIEYDDKKDKEKKVDETTVSGSVATGGDAPKKSKGGMQFGQGVYEGAIAESFDKKLGGILTEGMSVNVSTDDTGKKSITVNATDADADSLGNMLKMAGLFSSEGYSRTCEHCHGIHEAGACQAEQVAEELANSPDEVYADKDYMTQTLSGGLNGPKTTGQTTGPVINRQDNRQGVMAEAERVVEQSETRLWNLYKQYDKK